MAFEESKHPRDKNGQFTSKGGGASTGSTKSSSSTAKSKPIKYSREYDGLDEFFDVLSPQETADIMGKEVEDDGKIYKPKNRDIHDENDVWENWEEWPDYDAGKTHGYASVSDSKRMDKIVEKLNEINNLWKSDESELLKSWYTDKAISHDEYKKMSDELYNKANKEKEQLIKEMDEISKRAKDFQKQYNEKKKAKDENERKQARKLFNIDF